jgi:hypothetical protein
MSSIYILWDESHFWGLLIRRALSSWQIDHRLVRGHEIAQGLLASNPPKLLIVPGGWARGKARSLGESGISAIKRFVAEGGSYLGFCGGAGLGLSSKEGLSLTSWKRKGFDNRLHHFLSGHINVSLKIEHPLVPESLGESALLPVWWPGQFAPADDKTEALGRYHTPGPDFWVADLCLSALPEGTLSDWENLYGIKLLPDFLESRPAIVHGNYGKGSYVLSYLHLETPASHQANRWLSHLLDRLRNISPVKRKNVPAWELSTTPVNWPDENLYKAKRTIEKIIATGENNFLLFWRNPWLLGWRRGIPGAALNSLYALICEIMSCEPHPEAIMYWSRKQDEFCSVLKLFDEGVTGYLLSERFAMTMQNLAPESVFPRGIKEQRNALFGPPPGAGGIHARLQHILEELAYITFSAEQ